MGHRSELIEALGLLILLIIFFFVFGPGIIGIGLLGVLIIIVGIATIVFSFTIGLYTVYWAEKSERKALRILCLIFFICCIFGSWQMSYFNDIANSPEIIHAMRGSVLYTGLEGYPIAKTALSPLLGDDLAERIYNFIPSGYHWTVFMFKVPNYVNYIGIAQGDFEGFNIYRIKISEIHEYTILNRQWYVIEFSQIDVVNLFEASAYMVGKIPLGKIIFKVVSIGLLLPIPLLAIATFKTLGKQNVRPSAKMSEEKRRESSQVKCILCSRDIFGSYYTCRHCNAIFCTDEDCSQIRKNLKKCPKCGSSLVLDYHM